MINERRMNDVGTNTSDVVVESIESRPRMVNIETNTQQTLPIVDVLIPSNIRDNVNTPNVNLSILGYGPDSMRTSGMRSPPMWAQGVPVIPQLDGPRSLPVRDPVGE